MKTRSALFFLAVIFYSSCGSKNSGEQNEDVKTAETTDANLAQQMATIVGKSLNLNAVLGDTLSAEKTVLLYTGYDCGTCVLTGFKIIRSLDSLHRGTNVVVECQSNKGSDQIRYHYPKYIYSDVNDVIRKKLKYVKTPVILHLAASDKITSVYFPQTEVIVNAQLLDRIK